MASGSRSARTFLSANPGFSRLAVDNANPTNWTWLDLERREWKKLEKGHRWQDFADKWRSLEDFDVEDLSGSFLDDLSLPASIDQSLLVRKCYVEAEKLVWKRAMSFPDTGAIFTGQPGIGKTIFIWYLLARLLRMDQVILLHVTDQAVLFYNDGVYIASRDATPNDLPSPGRDSFIWFLFDLDPQGELPAFALHPQCFPLQGPSLNRDLYLWRKQRNPLYTVFPLWTIEELGLAARHSPKFNSFRMFLQNAIQTENWTNSSLSSTISNPGLIEFLKEHFQNEPDSFDEAFSILLDGLVTCFGVIPRQIFNAMFVDFNEVLDKHDSALNTPFEELQKTADDLSRAEPSADARGASHRLISLNNIGTLESKRLEIDFLSPVIAEKFSKRWLEESQVKAGSIIKHFLTIPQTRGLAGSLFVPFAHRLIADPDNTDGTWTLRLMKSRGDSNRFVLRDPDSLETVLGFPKIGRRLASFHSKDFPHLHENVYYTPTIINHPLFDSFLVKLPPLPEPQSLWLLQMTTSKLHKGSQMGYTVVQEIIDRITEQRQLIQPPPAKKRDVKGKGKAESLSVEVEVNFVLVRPAGQQEHAWVLPEGWVEPNVYLLELPLEHNVNPATTGTVQPRKREKRMSTAGNRGSARLYKK